MQFGKDRSEKSHFKLISTYYTIMVGRKASPREEQSFLRKLRKPMIEKRRRERINSSINTLRTVLKQSRPEIDCETKLDKADILELTVNHLTREQRKPISNESYTSGFQDCSRETIKFLATVGFIDPVELSRLKVYLQTVSLEHCAMEPISPSPQRFCSTPHSRFVPAFPSSISMATTPSMSHSYLQSFMSYSGDSYSVSSESDSSVLSNIISDETPWRPW